jgi:hypothetical protein
MQCWPENLDSVVNVQDEYDLSTLLHYLFRSNDIIAIVVLLKVPGIKLDLKDRFGRVPFQYAVADNFHILLRDLPKSSMQSMVRCHPLTFLQLAFALLK